VGQLAAPIIAHHDRDRFELFGYSIGANDGSIERQAAEQGCDIFRDVSGSTDLDIAEAIASDEVDILVDLNGYTRGSRSVVMTLRPAPVQVWMLGFPGTSGSDFVDYIVADRTALPPEQAMHFSEQPCWLPHACQTLDDRQAIATEPVTRAALGLPEDGPLLVSWQTPFKIEPRVFGLWMDILRAVPDAHLWLRRMPRTTRYNLGQEAVRHGIDPARIVYADETAPDKPGYLRNLVLADIALDTFIYNGHATTSDFLWAGVPVITQLGRHFAGRVAASLIEAAGLPELITYSDRAYRDLAVKLALDPDRLAALRVRLADNRAHAPLFDTARYVRHLEQGYEAMWARHLTGESPAPIVVEATS
jgi:predicted O-linked N-acetylglucosamine transferase (SPINDLY family)